VDHDGTVHRWTVGDVEIVRIEDDSFALPSDEPAPRWAIPDFAPSADEVGLAFSAIAIADGARRIVVDPWLANDGPRTRPDAASHVDRLLGELADAGFATDEVDTVVNSHYDGIGWNTRPEIDRPTFPNARYLFARDELDAWREDRFAPEVLGLEGIGVLDAAGVLDDVDPPLELTPNVRLEDAPGHAFGHLAVRITSGPATALVGGHLFLSPFQIGDPTVAADHDAVTATRTRRRLLQDLADHDGLLITTLLGGPGAGHVRRHGDSYRLDA
jgi:glyoxylase-like metal-dependent hydrolase (beta-lactamase superfamily II)